MQVGSIVKVKETNELIKIIRTHGDVLSGHFVNESGAAINPMRRHAMTWLPFQHSERVFSSARCDVIEV